MKQDAIKVDFRGINKFYGERIKQQFFFKQDFTSLPFDKISMRFSWRLRPFFGNFDEKGMKEKTKQRVLLFLKTWRVWRGKIRGSSNKSVMTVSESREAFGKIGVGSEPPLGRRSWR